MSTIFLDESGYTGYDLISQDQPAFVIGTIHLDEHECLKLKEQYFEGVKARELKHSRLAKRKNHQKFVLNFLSYIADNPGIVKISVTHKQFALCSKWVDLLVEPATRADGIDLYEDGANLALSHLLFYSLPAYNPRLFTALLKRFQTMLRERSIDSYDDFFNLVFRVSEPPELDDLLNWLRIAHVRFGHGLFDLIPENTLDLALSSSLRVMGEWRAEIQGPIDLVHDQSSNMSDLKDVWDALVDANLPPAIVGYDRRTIVFPIAIKQTLFEASHEYAGLQLADLIAGAMSRYATWQIRGKPVEDQFAYELSEVIGDFAVSPMWPEPKFTSEQLGTTGRDSQDPLEYIAKAIS